MNAPFAVAPTFGRSLEGLIAPLRADVAKAVAEAVRALEVPFDWLKLASAKDLVNERDWLARSAWAAVTIGLIEAAVSQRQANLKRALTWFTGSSDQNWERVDEAILELSLRADITDILPYLLDTYGRTTRLDVMRNEELREARIERKKIGSFYTPADVVDFMVESIASPAHLSEADEEHWFDPACGSGVFLLGALKHRNFNDGAARCQFASKQLHGIDIVPQACDFASFTIFAAAISAEQEPFKLWQSIRNNFVAVDATQFTTGNSASHLRSLLGLGDDPLRLICNPPYVSTGAVSALADGFPTRSLYLPFIEMAWRIANGPSDAASLVVPLALAANRSADHRRCRTALSQNGGDWTMLFFDRQPNALFGEEAKTRAAIVVRRPGPTPANIRTSGLLKWTSRQRANIFSEARATSMGQAAIANFVPKLSSEDEIALYRSLQAFRLQSGIRPVPVKAEAKDIVGAQLSSDVFIAGTAYNFLNVFRNYPDNLSWRGSLSTSGIHRLECEDFETADAVTAILASRLAFWLWHVECDGFHVPAWFLKELPLLNLKIDRASKVHLAQLGREVWAGLQDDVLVSTNRDRLTFAFRPTNIGSLRSLIDSQLLSLVGIDPAKTAMLENFEARVVSIDGSVRRAQPKIRTGDHQ